MFNSKKREGRTLAKGSEERLLLRRSVAGLTGASVPSVHVMTFGIGLAQMSGRAVILGAFVNVQLAVGALETAATRALVGSDA